MRDIGSNVDEHGSSQEDVGGSNLWRTFKDKTGLGLGLGSGSDQSSSSGDKRIPGAIIMSKMGNETLKAELGRSSWRLLHTMARKFPYTPTKDEQNALRDFIYLFARLYPCGDCAAHFKLILENNPPDVSGREGITQWTCKVHNIVNERLGKPIFDCSKVGDMWACSN
eukprot:jgi/Hompol1/5418/HPOL_004415-RA